MERRLPTKCTGGRVCANEAPSAHPFFHRAERFCLGYDEGLAVSFDLLERDEIRMYRQGRRIELISSSEIKLCESYITRKINCFPYFVFVLE